MVYDPYQTSNSNKVTSLEELAKKARQTPQYNRERQFSKLDYLNQIAQQRRQQLEPQVREQQRQVSKQYADLGRRIKEEAANLGMLRSGRVMNKLLPDVGREKIRALNEIEQRAMQQAYEQAFPIAQFGFSEQQYLDQLRNQQAQQLLNNLLNIYSLQTGQERWQRQFDLDKALAEAGLTGRYGGTPTLAYRQLMADLENQEWLRNLKEQQFQQEVAEAQRQQALAALQALMNYQLGVGGVTGDFPSLPGFKYGDVMIELLDRLGVS